MLQRLGGPGSKAGDEQDNIKKIQVFQIWNAEVENHLKAAEGYFKEVCRS